VFAILLLCGVLATLGDTTWVGRMVLSLVPLKIRISLEPEISAAVLCLSLAVLAALRWTAWWPTSGWPAYWRWPPRSNLIAVSSGHPMNAYPLAAEPGVAARTSTGAQRR